MRLTQGGLVGVVDATQPTISDWETGKTSPARGSLRLLADRFKDERRVFRWLEHGGPAPELIPADSPTPGQLDRLYGMAVLDLGSQVKDIDGEQYVPLVSVQRWLGRLADALGWDATQSGVGATAGRGEAAER